PYFIYTGLESENWLLPSTVATAGSTLGSLTILWMGIHGHQWVRQKISSSQSLLLIKAESWVKKFGQPLLLFSWMPFIGDMIVLLVSLTSPPVTSSVIYIFSGKSARYILLALSTLS